MEWKPISNVPKDGTTVMIGNWFKDAGGGYFGGARWLWIVSAAYDEGEGWFIFFNDEHIEPSKMKWFLEPTHWMPILEPPK